MTTNVKKRKAITFEQKYDIIDRIQNKNQKQSDVAKELNMPPTTINQIWLQREKILSESENFGISNKKRMRSAKFPEVEEAVFQWFKEVKSTTTLNVPISGDIIKTQADKYAAMLNVQDFHSSNGWLSNFQRRHNLVCKTRVGEETSVDRSSVQDWQTNVLPNLIKNYSPRDVFNADETGLFYKALPDKTIHFRGETCADGKASKDRLSLLFACNADGSEKFKVLVIGKSKRPRYVKYKYA